MDTDAVAAVTSPKSDPAVVAAMALDAIEADLTEILADETTRNVKQGLSTPPAQSAAVAA
jgi:hypothetical protein